ncbi:hypothetical protein [Aeromonas salmonicida]|uniref:hypothetical protein n=1 Tax=Aeromonas salmonicida TaxID=645 RepID=UPI003D75E076
MKKTLLAVTVSITLLGLTACNSENSSKEHIPLDLTIAHINDTHAHLDPTENALAIQPTGQELFKFYAKLGGYPRLKFKLDELRSQAANEGRNFMVLNGGDAFQGTLYFTQFKGEEESRLLSDMGIDAMVLGNGVVAQISQQIMISPAPSDRYTRGFLTGRPRVFSLFIALTYAITSPT